MEDDYTDLVDSKYDTVNKSNEEKNIESELKQKSKTNLASKRPIQSATETLDIEPLDEINLVKANQQSENFEIDDPW